MGSVINYIDCPNCNQNNCFCDYYYKTGEEFTLCPDCGYHESHKYKRDENGNFIRKDETKGFEFDNLIPEHVLIDKPFGAFLIVSDSDGSCGGCLKDEKEYQNFLEDVSNTENHKQGIKLITISRFINGEIKVEKIYEN